MATNEDPGRDRDAAFARAGADVLVEVDSRARIQFISGVAPVVTAHTSDQLIGAPLATLLDVDVAGDDAGAHAPNGSTRFGPVTTRVAGFDGQAVVRGARANDGSGRVFLAIVLERPHAAQALDTALAADALSYALQPIVTIATGAVARFEVLARFPDGRDPYASVVLAEKAGLAAALDLRVAARAVEALVAAPRHRADAHAPQAHAGLAVNISGLSIVKPGFVEELATLAEPLGRRRSALTFEITETAAIPHLAVANAAIQRLRGLGHPVCLDDFGAGSASFPYLQALEVDAVKIDGGYVRRATASARDAALLRGMVRLCRDLGVPTIAECVETDDQVALVRALGVEMGQGFLFGRPTPLTERAHAA